MIKKIILAGLMFIITTFAVSGSLDSNSISCNWVPDDGTCSQNNIVLYAHEDSFDASGLVISSNTQLFSGFTPEQQKYSRVLCCVPKTGVVDFTAIAGDVCPADYERIISFTNDSNARASYEFNPAHHYNSSCVYFSEQFSRMDVFYTADKKLADFYERKGYECLYRTNDFVNGHVSDCDATFDGTNKYNVSVWIRLWENVDNYDCNSDCTSKLDNRVYSGCSEKIRECANVDPLCDGSLLGSWVQYNATHEMQCIFPWDNYRKKVFSAEKLKVESTGDCKNVVVKKYSVMIDNELVNMNIYSCSN